MGKRTVLAVILVGFVVSEANAQFNRHRRRGTILGGVVGAAVGAAIGNRRNNQAAGAVIGGAAGAVIGRSIGAQKDHQIEHHYSAPSRHTGSHHVYGQPHHVYGQPHHHQHGSPRVPQPAPAIILTPPTAHAAPLDAPIMPAARPLSQIDVVSMLQGGLSEPMVISQIQRYGMSHPLTVGDIIHLHRQGISEGLIEIMQAHVVYDPVVEGTYP